MSAPFTLESHSCEQATRRFSIRLGVFAVCAVAATFYFEDVTEFCYVLETLKARMILLSDLRKSVKYTTYFSKDDYNEMLHLAAF